MLRVDGDDLPQAFFALGVVCRDRGQPQPGVLIARLGNQHEIEHLAGFVRQSALRGEYRLTEEFFGAHRYGYCSRAGTKVNRTKDTSQARLAKFVLILVLLILMEHPVRHPETDRGWQHHYQESRAAGTGVITKWIDQSTADKPAKSKHFHPANCQSFHALANNNQQ